MNNVFPTATIPAPAVNNIPGVNTTTGSVPTFATVSSPNPVINTNMYRNVNNPVIDAAAGPKCNVSWVEGIEEVLKYPTSPKEQMYFHDKNDPIIYCRETDGNGNIINPIRVLHYTVEEMPFGPEAQFVTKDEHKQLYNLVEKLAANVDSMNDKLEKLING